jgi:hypothetical protein
LEVSQLALRNFDWPRAEGFLGEDCLVIALHYRLAQILSQCLCL